LSETPATDGKNLVWFGEIERKLAKLSTTTFTYRSSYELFYNSDQPGKNGQDREEKCSPCHADENLCRNHIRPWVYVHFGQLWLAG
jgi:hypothetical protein